MAEHEDRNAKNAAVVHNASNQRFEIDIDGQLSILEHTFKNHRLFLMHTEVPPALESQGLGTKLAHAALEYARQNDLTVIAICPFVQDYVVSHPEIPVVCDRFSCLTHGSYRNRWAPCFQATSEQIIVESSV
jgi:predicted GNAT family acetyltransferase